MSDAADGVPPFSRAALMDALALVYRQMPPTPQYLWPQISAAAGAEVWVKHENHTPTGAFKVRGGITFVDWLLCNHPQCTGIVTATRGNHGQSQARAASAAGLAVTVVVPVGNAAEKNAAMRAFGAEVIESGKDFDSARETANELAKARQQYLVPSFHPALVIGVASYAWELFEAVPALDTIYVPIGLGSGICGLIQTRDLLGLGTEIVGVVASGADAALRSLRAGRLVSTSTANTFADGMAVRVPAQAAFDIYAKGAARIVAVEDEQIADAMRLYYRTTHNVAEGAGAAALAALLAERDRQAGQRVAVILCGGNIDAELFAQVLQGTTPAPF